MSGPILQDVHALPIHYAPIGHTAPRGVAWSDPLLPAVTRFVAARPFTGPGALKRRFGIGLNRARWLLIELEGQGVVRGHWKRLVAASYAKEGDTYSFRMYRVRPWSWAKVQGGAADGDPC